MTGDTMKSGVADTDRVKIEGRHSFPRRKMSKNSPIVNGGDSYAEDDSMMARQVNLAAAYHDHISCTKSAELCKIPDSKESRASLPCETDHIYATCCIDNGKKTTHVLSSNAMSRDKNDDKRKLQDMCLMQLELIKDLEEQNSSKDKQIFALKRENELLKVRQERMERRMCLFKRNMRSDNESDSMSDIGSVVSDTQPAPAAEQSSQQSSSKAQVKPTTMQNLVTRYFGRRSKTIPFRALKRRYLGPPKSFPCKKPTTELSVPTSTTSSVSNDSGSCSREIKTVQSANSSVPLLPSPHDELPSETLAVVAKRRSKKMKVIPPIGEFFTTTKEYYLPDVFSKLNLLDHSGTIDVPSWRFQPVTSFYQMEGTENIDDRVFQRRHLKCEQDEKRRKRWDIQRLRELRTNEKLKQKCDNRSGTNEQVSKEFQTLYPNPIGIEFIEVTDTLPVLAFGRPIPLFQPSEFSLPWDTGNDHDVKQQHMDSCETKVT